MSGQTQHSPVKTSNLPDKCSMTGANLQACLSVNRGTRILTLRLTGGTGDYFCLSYMRYS